MQTTVTAESLLGLRIKYVMRHDPMLKIEGNDLNRNNLSEHDLKMLQSVDVPRHLPVHIEEIDGNISLMYGYKGKKNLAVEAEQERLDLHQYVAILMEISAVIKRAPDYLLNGEHYVLDPNWVWIGETWEDLYLRYLPIHQWQEREDSFETIGDQLKQFSLSLMPYVNKLEGTVFQQFIGALDQRPFSLNKIIEILNVVQTEPLQENPVHLTESNDQEKPWEEIVTEEAESAPWEEEAYIPESAQPIPWQAGLKGVLTACVLIGLYFIWKPYVLAPQDGVLIMNCGLTLLLLTGALTALRWPSRTSAPALESPTVEEEAEADAAYVSAFPWRKIEQPTERDVVHNMPQQTVMLAPNDRTVLLQRQQDTPYLQLLKAGSSGVNQESEEVRPIDQSPFIVGRDEKRAQWVVNEAGISRTHFVIVQESEGTMFRDLGSSNGTVLNNEPVAPYKWYELHDRDRIQIGHKQFVYCKT